MFCSSCGAEVAGHAKFCSNCGAIVQAAALAKDTGDWGMLRWGVSKDEAAKLYLKEGVRNAAEGNALSLDRVEVEGHAFDGLLGFDAKRHTLTHVVLTSRLSDETWHDVVRALMKTYGPDPVRSEGEGFLGLLWRSDRTRIKLENDAATRKRIVLEFSDKQRAGRPWIEEWLSPVVEAAELDTKVFGSLMVFMGACFQARRKEPKGDLPAMGMVRTDPTGHLANIFDHVKSWDAERLSLLASRLQAYRRAAIT